MNESKIKDKLIEKLQRLQIVSDTELDHLLADDLLCEFLKSLGFIDVVTEYQKIDKWYA